MSRFEAMLSCWQRIARRPVMRTSVHLCEYASTQSSFPVIWAMTADFGAEGYERLRSMFKIGRWRR